MKKPTAKQILGMVGQRVRATFPGFLEVAEGPLVKVEMTASGKRVRSISIKTEDGYKMPSLFYWGDVGEVQLIG